MEGMRIHTIGYGGRGRVPRRRSLGALLGGKPDDADPRDASGHVDYERLRHRASAARGAREPGGRLGGGHRIALMCSEGKPQECHRTKLLAEELVANRVPVAHIDEHGTIRSHAEITDMITDGQEALFGGHAAALRSRTCVA